MAERPLSAGPFHWLGLLSVAIAALAADQLTKQIVVTQLGVGEAVHVTGPLYIAHVKNPGIAFGLFSSWASAVTFVTAGAVFWMLFYFAKSGARHPILPVALGLLDLRFWPAFNLADTFIVVGVAALLLALISAERQPRIRRTHSNRPAPKTLG